MLFVETHAHYNLPAYADDLDEVIASVRAAGVGKIICPAISYASNAKMIEALSGVPDVFFAVGIHPKRACPKRLGVREMPTGASLRKLRSWHAERVAFIDELEAQVDGLRALAEGNERVVAVGEAGLDYSLNPSPFERAVQVGLFQLQVQLALKLHLPLVLHIRDAHEDALAVLRSYRGAARGVVHCFSAGVAEANDYLELGLYLGIGGRVTHESRCGVREAVAETPADRLVLETDAPYVLPAGFPSDRNDSTAIPLIAHEVAQLRGVSVEEIAEQTTRNAEQLFFARRS